MGDTENTEPGPGNSDDALQALREGVSAPPPPEPPNCPHCGLTQDRYPTLYDGHWVLLEPDVIAPAHHLPPRRRWVITVDGIAVNTWDAEPTPGAECRVAHRMLCPHLEPAPWTWPWGTAMRKENERRAGRLFNLPDLRDLPDAS
ncbi:DUF6083 domain-containing protein [Streptomyces sp. NBC_01260]|uniref:DUF6083 domain-containing protein n=1 Tax=unclassified Streptomyces TaxID=2593676 RepID=UPI000F463539|nr:MULTISPECIES: DUF6083 domain-containing protein [unclassified Streptomyces]MCX4774880.1 DUF6083 domain-containing protein [Streptomyces sp. NBC_01285]ROQ78326.1 hypothetical protein EDD95_4948 [Streptomyces sp. CEV 2-1]RPK37282.1 hypothetical protein EES39_30905 [Streptomyces sp. ADI92-24]